MKEDVTNRILYTGQQYDQETGQYYLRARYRGGSRSAQGLTGKDFENYLTDIIGGNGSFSVGGREFDGSVSN